MTILKIRMKQFTEEIRENGPSEAARKTLQLFFCLNRMVVPTYKDLGAIGEPARPPGADEFRFLVVSGENIGRVEPMYVVESRRLKAVHNSAKGYIAFAVAVKDEIVGDIWCVAPRGKGALTVHPDLEWLGIRCGEKETYMFDMYVRPDRRGNAVSNYLLGNALFALKEKGYSRVYGFYESRNLSALWAHRVAKYTEMEKRRIRQFFFYRTSRVA